MRQITAPCFLLLILLAAGGCASSRLTMENISKNYGMLSYDDGALIPTVPEETRTEMMKNYCAPMQYEIIETDRKTVAQYHSRTKILFKCVERDK
jgi:hypothetical protein